MYVCMNEYIYIYIYVLSVLRIGKHVLFYYFLGGDCFCRGAHEWYRLFYDFLCVMPPLPKNRYYRFLNELFTICS